MSKYSFIVIENLITLLLCFFIGSAMSEDSAIQRNNQARRLILILDSETKTQRGMDALPVLLAVALSQKTSPIITTGSILTDFLSRKFQPDLKLLLCRKSERRKYNKVKSCLVCRSKLGDEILKAYSEGDDCNDYGILLEQWNKLKLSTMLSEIVEYYLWSLVPFNKSEWIIERGVGENDSLFLLIPRSLADYANDDHFARNELLPVLGFNPTMFCVQDFDALCSEGNYIKMFGDFSKKWPVGDLRKCFMVSSGPWNVYLTGHGLPLSKKDGDALVAGLSPDQFCDLLRFFNDKITMNFLFYNTCYGGGYAQIVLYENLYSQVEKQLCFPIACGSTTDLPAVGFMLSSSLFPSRVQIQQGLGYPLCCSDEKSIAPLLKKITVPLDFTLFFSLLDTLFLNPEKKCTKDVWQKLFRSITSIPANESAACVQSTPLLKLPERDDFVAIPLDKKVTVVTYKKLQKYEKANKPLRFRDKKGVLVYPAIITVPFVFEGAEVPKMISMNPEPALHCFNDLFLVDVSIEQMILSFADSQCVVVTDKVFLFRNVAGKTTSGQLIALQDLMIEVRSDQPYFIMGKSGTYFFKGFNGHKKGSLVAITEAEYRAGMSAIVERLKKRHAELVPASRVFKAQQTNIASFDSVMEYINAAMEPFLSIKSKLLPAFLFGALSIQARWYELLGGREWLVDVDIP